MSWELIIEHIYLVTASCAAVILLGVPLGILSYLYPRVGRVILSTVDLLQTVPVLAVMGLLMTVFGANSLTAILSMVLYLLLPVVRNTNTGLEAVDPVLKEAADAMGMSKARKLRLVELPMAFPFILMGIRIAAVTSIGVAVFATFVGGGGLGKLLYRGIRIQNFKLILQGTLVLMAASAILDYLLSLLEKRIGGNQ